MNRSAGAAKPTLDRGVVIVLSLAMFVIVIDTTIMNVSIGALVEDLDTEVSTIQAAIALYALVMASFMITGGKLGDILGRKRTFVIGLVLYGTGSAGTAISQNALMLIVFWSVIEGLGAALLMPAIQTLIRGNFAGQARAKMYGIVGAVGGAGVALGPVIGGFVTTAFSWRWAFAGETVIVLIVLSQRSRLTDVPYEGRPPKLDVVGMILSALGLGAIVVGILASKTFGWVTAKASFSLFGVEVLPQGGVSVTAVLMLLGAAVLAAFYLWERRLLLADGDPLVRVTLFRNPALTSGVSVYLLQQLVVGGILFLIPVFVLNYLGFDALEAGITLLPMSVGMFVTSIAASGLGARISPKHIIQAGLVLTFAGVAVLMLSLGSGTEAIDLAPGLVLVGAGLGAMISQLNNLILSSVEPNEAAEAAGISMTGGQFGLSLGTALVGALALAALTTSVADLANESTVLDEAQRTAIVDALDDDTEHVEDTDVEALLEDAPDDVADEIRRIGKEALPRAVKGALVAPLVGAALGLALSVKLPKRKLVPLPPVQ